MFLLFISSWCMSLYKHVRHYGDNKRGTCGGAVMYDMRLRITRQYALWNLYNICYFFDKSDLTIDSSSASNSEIRCSKSVNNVTYLLKDALNTQQKRLIAIIFYITQRTSHLSKIRTNTNTNFHINK